MYPEQRIYPQVAVSAIAQGERRQQHGYGPKRWVSPPVAHHKEERGQAIRHRETTPALPSPGLLTQLPMAVSPEEQFFQNRLPSYQGKKCWGQYLGQCDGLDRNTQA